MQNAAIHENEKTMLYGNNDVEEPRSKQRDTLAVNFQSRLRNNRSYNPDLIRFQSFSAAL